MKPRERSNTLLGVTRSKAKMYEYSVPLEDHIAIARNPAHLFPVSIALLGDVAADLCRREVNENVLKENTKDLRFSAQFFDSYIQTQLNHDFDQHFFLLAAAAYYLCELPGSATALLARMRGDMLNFANRELGKFLYWLLKSDFGNDLEFSPEICREEFNTLKDGIRSYFAGQGPRDGIDGLAREIRNLVYQVGSPRELLLTDVCFAVLKLKLMYSVRSTLPEFSGLPIESWNPVLVRPQFMKEFWPSQRLLGKTGVFSGASAVVQMPTSAGKSKSIEVMIRSAFLSGRAKTCVVVAPFRALCREITETLEKAFQGENVTINELSDVFQKDFDSELLLGNDAWQVLSVTPEKLVYVLRQTPELAQEIGLLILDEGHQFDSGTRGVTSQLLITNLKGALKAETQIVLISAVISNAEAICSWLLGERGTVVKDSSLTPTFRTVGFSTWTTTHGRIQYVQSDDLKKEEFWVPKVLESQKLQKMPRERKERFFPEASEGSTVAAHLGITGW